MAPVAGPAWLVATGALAGLIGSAGGITSLVSYPALLVAGLPPLRANVANLVAVVACWPGSWVGSRRELAGSRARLVRGAAVAAIGGLAGALLLRSTPAGAFANVVPFLVLLASLALVASPRLIARRVGATAEGSRAGLAAVGLVSVYGGYFGAGSGVMVLVAALVSLDPRLPQANALKNMLVGAAGVASAAVFVIAGPVEWHAVLPLAAGLFVGSIAGPRIPRRVPAAVIRWTVAALGLALAVELWVTR